MKPVIMTHTIIAHLCDVRVLACSAGPSLTGHVDEHNGYA